MTTSNSSFLLGIKVLGLTAIVAILFSSSANLAITIQSSYGQFSQPEKSSSTPSPPPTTTAAGEGGNTSGIVEGRPTIMSLNFSPDGTGFLTVDYNNGTLSPVTLFNHTLTEENGYTWNNGLFFFINNGTQVNLNSIDFSSQIILDPKSNVTLPAKPNFSPYVIEQFSEEGFLAQSAAAPQTTTTIPPSPPTSSTSQGVVIDRQTAAQLAAEDPAFANFDAVMTTCFNQAMTPETTTNRVTYEQCAKTAQEGADRWCGLEFYDALKCEYASRLAENYKKIAGILGPGGSDTFEKLFGGGGILD